MQEHHPPLSIKGPTIRFTFEYEGENIKLIDAQKAEMKIPRPIMGDFEKDKAGFWVELEDEQQETLCQCFISNPLRDSVEVYSPDGTIERKANPQAKGHFVILAPELEKAKFVSIHRNPNLKTKERSLTSSSEVLFRTEIGS